MEKAYNFSSEIAKYTFLELMNVLFTQTHIFLSLFKLWKAKVVCKKHPYRHSAAPSVFIKECEKFFIYETVTQDIYFRLPNRETQI